MRAFASPILVLLLFAAMVSGQQSPIPTPAPAATDTPAPAAKEIKPLTVVPGEMEIQKLVELIGRYARCNILCDTAELGRIKTITLTEPVELDRASCMEALSSLLYTVGFGLLPVDEQKGIFQVVSMNGPRGRDLDAAAMVRSVAEVLAHPDSKRVVMTNVPLVHVNAAVMSNLLRPLLVGGGPSGVTLAGGARNASMIVRGSQFHVAAAVRLIQENDKPGKPIEREVKLEERVAELEKQLAELKAQLAELQKAAAGK